MTRLASLLSIGLVIVACDGKTADPPPSSNTPAAPLAETCAELQTDAMLVVNEALPDPPCNVDTDCNELNGAIADCLWDCNVIVSTLVVPNRFAAARAAVNANQCARFTAQGCAPTPTSCPTGDDVSMGAGCIEHVCLPRHALYQSNGLVTGNGTASGSGTSCTFGVDDPNVPAITYALGAGAITPDGCERCVCTSLGFACVGSCPKAATDGP